jgi:hypothetical protein
VQPSSTVRSQTLHSACGVGQVSPTPAAHLDWANRKYKQTVISLSF